MGGDVVAEASVNSGPRGRRWLAAAAVLYAAAVATVLFWPVHVDGDGGLFRFDPVLRLLGRFGIPAWASYSMLEFVSNAALFLPLGVLWSLAVDRWPAVIRILTAGLLAAAISIGAELVQGAFIADRTMDPRDVVANSLGALIGAIAATLMVRVVRRARRDGARPVPAADRA